MANRDGDRSVLASGEGCMSDFSSSWLEIKCLGMALSLEFHVVREFPDRPIDRGSLPVDPLLDAPGERYGLLFFAPIMFSWLKSVVVPA